jgi:hypothetical protein
MLLNGPHLSLALPVLGEDRQQVRADDRSGRAWPSLLRHASHQLGGLAVADVHVGGLEPRPAALALGQRQRPARAHDLALFSGRGPPRAPSGDGVPPPQLAPGERPLGHPRHAGSGPSCSARRRPARPHRAGSRAVAPSWRRPSTSCSSWRYSQANAPSAVARTGATMSTRAHPSARSAQVSDR